MLHGGYYDQYTYCKIKFTVLAVKNICCFPTMSKLLVLLCHESLCVFDLPFIYLSVESL